MYLHSYRSLRNKIGTDIPSDKIYFRTEKAQQTGIKDNSFICLLGVGGYTISETLDNLLLQNIQFTALIFEGATIRIQKRAKKFEYANKRRSKNKSRIPK